MNNQLFCFCIFKKQGVFWQTLIHHFKQHNFCKKQNKRYLCNQIPVFVVLQVMQSEYRMKKVTAIFLLLMMMLSGVQPVLAMHFCGNELYSFSLVQTAVNLHCCCDNVEQTVEQTEKQTPKTANIPVGGPHHTCILGEANETCCVTQLLTIDTDDYQGKTEQLVSRMASISFDDAFALLIPLFRLSEPETNTLSFFQDFPPKGLFLQDVSLLTYICIYRI